MGHNLFLGRTVYGPFLWCNTCGAQSQTNVVNLKKKCRNSWAKTVGNLKKIRKGIHPTYGHAIWDVQSVRRIKLREKIHYELPEEVHLFGNSVRSDGVGLPLRFWEEWHENACH